MEQLGIEKAYLITTLNNKEQIESLIKITLNKNLTVKQLIYVIELVNRNIIENPNRACDEALAATKERRLSTELSKLKNGNKDSEQKQKTEPKIYTATQYEELKEKCNLLEQRNKELELKLQQYEDAKISSASES